MLKRGNTFTISNGLISPSLNKNLDCFGVIWSAIAKNNRLDQCRPSKVVDMVQGCTGCDQSGNHLMMAQMCGGNQGGAVINAGDQIRFVAKRQRQRDQFWVIRHRSNRDNIIHTVFECIHICTACGKRLQGVILRGEGGDMRRGAFSTVSDIRVGTTSEQTCDVI